MAGTITVTEEVIKNVTKLTYDWLTDASGDASITATSKAYSGVILKVVAVPDSGGTAPSDLYDITLTDGASLDVLTGQGTDCPSGSNLVIVDDLLPVANDTLSLTVANGGNAKGGIVYVYIR